MSHMNVILTGFMGTGKSTVGKILAKQLKYQFVDTDALIEDRQQRSIADIFADSGELAFRQMEAELAEELAQQSALVISTGGKFMLNEHNADLLSLNSLIFCLSASPETIIKRLSSNVARAQRPLLKTDNPSEHILKLMEERQAGYSRFEQVDTNNKPPAQIARHIYNRLNKTALAQNA